MLYIWFYGEKNFINFFLVLKLVGTSIDLVGGGVVAQQSRATLEKLIIFFAPTYLVINTFFN